MQSALCNRRRIETTFEGEAGFFRCVIKSADYEILAVMSLWAPRQFFVLIRKPLDNFRPGDIRPEF